MANPYDTSTKKSQGSTETEVENTAPGQSPIATNIEALIALKNADELALSRHQRTIEKLVAVISVPAFLYVSLTLIASWVAANVALRVAGFGMWDKPPFAWLQSFVSLLALIVTCVVVITQNRLGKVAERNAQLDLHVNLLVDQKVTKVIQLLEEMRSDSPHLRDRVDEEATKLQAVFDPVEVAGAIAEKEIAPGSEEIAEESAEKAKDQ